MLRFMIAALFTLSPAAGLADDTTLREKLKRQEQELERAKQRYREAERRYKAIQVEPSIVDPAELQRIIERLQRDGLLKRHPRPEKQLLENLKELQDEAAKLKARAQELEAERLELVAERLEALKVDDDIRKPIYRNGPPPAPLPEGLTGKVTEYKGEYLALDIGLDAGLAVGTKLDLWRGEGAEAKLLGKVVVERVYPKEAVAKFTPASGQAIKDLKPDELPKNRDSVGTYKGK